MPEKSLFDDFPKTTKAQWLAHIAQEARSAPLLDKIDWSIGPLSIPGYAAQEDLEDSFPHESNSNRRVFRVETPHWNIGATAPSFRNVISINGDISDAPNTLAKALVELESLFRTQSKNDKTCAEVLVDTVFDFSLSPLILF